ncbi:MAG: acetyl-CoA carboxylase subunit beta [Elusimicrobia bacterium RIFOXYC2_FULL_34_12]|nr:MAG: acetyl-CoA carboxylase subunit beta [Elusimicrobia bacterium RIFOXYC2_FULL_34_12]OGS38505.1 MAG: acetyl-CoA carboxylase subunit beta [Elusimicrobia bacterium RIFOXYD2_FULL_34_30]HAM38490.1 acetyl-CoA carboxylase carboxyl transferase subunit beta [Elusimicrobiota bacterium]
MPVEKPKKKMSVPDGLWRKCDGCQNIIYNKELTENLFVCPKCGYYFRLSTQERIKQLLDENSFNEIEPNLETTDPLNFKDSQKYSSRIIKTKTKTKLNEAVNIGIGKINGVEIVICVMNFDFMGGSMGSVVGEKITIAIETAIDKKIPLIIVSSSGGARMQEGIFSLMQMAKTSAALARLSEKNIPYLSILTHPVTGGVSASFAFLGDIIIAEPKALIGFAGPRVIEQTIKQKLPEGFQLSEFLLEHGQIDMIVERKELKNTVSRILNMLN